MDLVGFDHVQLAIPRGGEDVARRFWIDVLGFVEIEKPAEMKKRGGAWFACGPAAIHVGAEEAFVPAKKAHPALRVADAAAAHRIAARLAAAGFSPRWSREVPGFARFHVDDPFGNRLEFTT